MAETNQGYPSPICQIHEGTLNEIKDLVLDVKMELVELKEMDGPLGNHERRIGAVETSDRRAHKRIDTLRTDFKKLADSQTGLIIKVGLVMVPLAAGVGAAIAELMKMG
jgi:hypothetical protein